MRGVCICRCVKGRVIGAKNQTGKVNYCVWLHLSCILSQTSNVTQNEAEVDCSKFSKRTKMTNMSQKHPINILKPLILSADKG